MIGEHEYNRAYALMEAYEQVESGLRGALYGFEELDDNYDVDQELSLVEEAIEIVSKKLEDAESVMTTFDMEADRELIRDSYRW